ncbi:MAG: molybdopterin-binding protein [Coriobacteriia bacterium]|nr:molybdopterin-binding protein [Coriobacteriia bacterium]MBS5477882.1 molybdopterin-binding protein [Coriobacteriia bacterium]
MGERTQTHRVGQPVELSGYASDYDRAIVAMQFSLNGWRSWTTYPVEGADSRRWVRWSFSYVPEQAGTYLFEARSVNELGQVSPTPARVQFDVA